MIAITGPQARARIYHSIIKNGGGANALIAQGICVIADSDLDSAALGDEAVFEHNVVAELQAQGEVLIDQSVITRRLLIRESCKVAAVLDNLIQGVVEIHAPVWIKFNHIAGGELGLVFDGYDPTGCTWALTIQWNNIVGDSLFSVLLKDTSAAVALPNNWWGRAVTAEMATLGCDANIAAIHDGRDEVGLGIVDYCQWATAPLGLPVLRLWGLKLHLPLILMNR